jgi:hypothetical protein
MSAMQLVFRMDMQVLAPAARGLGDIGVLAVTKLSS